MKICSSLMHIKKKRKMHIQNYSEIQFLTYHIVKTHKLKNTLCAKTMEKQEFIHSSWKCKQRLIASSYQNYECIYICLGNPIYFWGFIPQIHLYLIKLYMHIATLFVTARNKETSVDVVGTNIQIIEWYAAVKKNEKASNILKWTLSCRQRGNLKHVLFFPPIVIEKHWNRFFKKTLQYKQKGEKPAHATHKRRKINGH